MKKQKKEEPIVVRGYLVNMGYWVQFIGEPRKNRQGVWRPGAQHEICASGLRALGFKVPRKKDVPVPFTMTIRLGD